MGAATPPKEPALNIPVKSVFDADEPMFTPNTATTPRPSMTTTIASPAIGTAPAPLATAPAVDAMIAAGHGKRRLGMIIGGIAGLLVLAAAGYFIAPMILGGNAPEEVVTTPPPVTPVEPTVPTPPAPPVTPSGSLFTVAPIKRVPTTIEAQLTLAALRQAFEKEAAATGSVEIQLVNAENTPIPFTDVIAAVAPTLKAQTETLFAGPNSIYVYADENGAWPGYVAALKEGADPAAIKAWFEALEKTNEKQNFFISNPGTFQPFKNGMVNNTYPDRYATATKTGSSIGYLIIPEKQLVFIATSFPALRDGLRLAGL